MKKNAPTLLESYKTMLKIAGHKAPELKKSYLTYTAAYIARGLAFVCFFPLLNGVFSDQFMLQEALLWLAVIAILTLISIGFKWHALNFGYTNELTEVIHDLRLKLGNKIKTIPLQKLNRYRSGELSSILQQNVDEAALPIGVVVGMALEATIVPIVIIGAFFFIDVRIAFVIVLAFPLAFIIYNWSKRERRKEKSDNEIAHAALEADTVEYLQGLSVLRSVNQVGAKAKKLQQSIAEVREVQGKGAGTAIVPMVIMNTLIEFIFITVIILGSFWIMNATLTIATLLSMLIVLNRMSEPLANFLAIAAALDIMEVGFNNIEKILDEKNLQVHEPRAIPERFDIAFRDVSFGYLDGGARVFENLSLTIKANALTAIVGDSGTGKTTVTRLVMRYDDPDKGVITIGDVDIRNMAQEELMGLVSVVFQDVYLFDDSIFNNIRMGNPGATDKEVITAAKKAYCHEFIERLPEAYNTQVGEIGGSLSGGERQRISIARAILKDAPIVILDEPTSSLDTESEVAVQKALDSLIKNKTVIVIAHRLSTISHADTILVIEDGKLTEQGNHYELLKKQGKYTDMFRAQQRIKQWNIAHG